MSELNEPVLKIEHLFKSFKTSGKTIKAVDDVSFEIKKGECFGLVGESGCGKSTLSSLISLLQKSDSGVIKFKGKDISELKGSELKAFRKHLQIIFQDPYSSLNPKMKIAEILEEPLIIHNIGSSKQERQKIINEIRTLIALEPEVLQKFPSQLSGGQRQRIAIAASVILHPEFLICDECVSALDVLVQAQILNLLKSMQKTLGMTYLFISHNLNVVAYMADRIAVMKNGRIIEIADTKTLVENPQHPYTKQLLQTAGIL